MVKKFLKRLFKTTRMKVDGFRRGRKRLMDDEFLSFLKDRSGEAEDISLEDVRKRRGT